MLRATALPTIENVVGKFSTTPVNWYTEQQRRDVTTFDLAVSKSPGRPDIDFEHVS